MNDEIIKARGTIKALRLTATKRPHAETERLIREQERRIEELEAQQAPTAEAIGVPLRMQPSGVCVVGDPADLRPGTIVQRWTRTPWGSNRYGNPITVERLRRGAIQPRQPRKTTPR